MITKKVSNNCRVTTVTAAEEVTAVEFASDYKYFQLRNDSDETAYLSESADVAESADGTMSIPAGGCGQIFACSSDTCYIKGAGTVLVAASNLPDWGFKSAPKGGDSGTDITAVGNPVKLDGLQGGTPLSEIIVSGDGIVGQEVTISVGRENLLEEVIDYGYTTTLTFRWGFGVTAYAKCKPNTVYTVHKKGGNMLAAVSAKEKPAQNVAFFDRVIADTAAETMTYTTGNEAVYVAFVLSSDTADISNITDVRIELGDTTAEEPYSVKITPDSDNYIVSDDIRQLDGLNVISATAGALSVTGVRKNAAVGKIWSELDSDEGATSDGTIVKSGNPIAFSNLQGNVPYGEVVISGKNLMPFPYQLTSFAGNATYGYDLSFGNRYIYCTATNGKVTKSYDHVLCGFYLPQGQYTISDANNIAITNDCYIYVAVYDGSTYVSVASTAPSDSATFMLDEETRVVVYLSIKEGAITQSHTNGWYILPQLEKGDVATEYEPQLNGANIVITVNDTSYTVVPTTIPYNVPLPIMQDSGDNNISVPDYSSGINFANRTDIAPVNLDVTAISAGNPAGLLWDKQSVLLYDGSVSTSFYVDWLPYKFIIAQFEYSRGSNYNEVVGIFKPYTGDKTSHIYNIVIPLSATNFSSVDFTVHDLALNGRVSVSIANATFVNRVRLWGIS